MNIILLCGSAQNGKSSTASILEEELKTRGHRPLRIAYGDYVKFVAKQYFGWSGKKDKVGRTILQQVGTEIFRSKDENFWTDTVIRYCKVMSDEYDFAIIDDCRFPNEIERWADFKFKNVKTIKITRPNFDNGLTEIQKRHASETALDEYAFDYEVIAENLEELNDIVKNDLMGWLLETQ